MKIVDIKVYKEQSILKGCIYRIDVVTDKNYYGIAFADTVKGASEGLAAIGEFLGKLDEN